MNVNQVSLICTLGIAAAVFPSLLRRVLFAWHPFLMSLAFLGEAGCG